MLDTTNIQIHVPNINFTTNNNGANNNSIYGAGNGTNSKQSSLGYDGKKSGNFRIKSTSTSSYSQSVGNQKRFTMPLIYRMYESLSENLCGTINGPSDDEFHPEEASKALRQALSAGIQSDDKILINVLLSHNNFQRQKIASAYEGMYNRRLSSDIEEEIGGYFLEIVLALIQPAHVYSARLLSSALSGRTVKRSIAVEIALTSTASQLKVIRDAYQAENRVALERDLSIKVEGLFGKMLNQLLMRNKDFDEEVDVELADKEVLTLNSNKNTGLEEIGRNLELFNQLFASQGLNQIRAFLERYDAHAMSNLISNGDLISNGSISGATIENEMRGKDFESMIRKNVQIHSDIRQMLILFIRISRNMQLYFAEKLYEAISGTRPDHSSIIRILVSRSEIDLSDICDEYKRKYGHHVFFDLKNACSGDFLRLLLQLVHPANFNDDAFVS